MPMKIAVIADDLTGANDTGVQFAKQGLDTLVLMGETLSPGDLAADVVVVDTQSRAIPPHEAYRKAAKAAALFQDGPQRTLYKKVDSTLRGNLGSEIDAIMDTWGLELAIVAPAFPKNGRVSVGGFLLLQGVPLAATEIARDPKCPVSESHLPTLLAEQTKRGVGHVGVAQILAGTQAMAQSMAAQLAEGRRILVCDVWQDEQFPLILQAGLMLGKPVLWVGSAGLAEHLPKALGLNPCAHQAAPVLVMAGSVSNTTRAQVARLKKRPDMTGLELDACELLDPARRALEISRCFEAAAQAVAQGRDVVVTSGHTDEVVVKTAKEGFRLGLDARRTAEEVALALGEVCRRLATELPVGGLVLTGGDTAVSCCTALRATGLQVVSEVAPGIPVGVLRGGDRHGLRVVTKAGAFGVEDALSRAVDCLKQ